MNESEFRKICAETVQATIELMKNNGMPEDAAAGEILTMSIYCCELIRALFDEDDDNIEIER